MNTFRFDNKKKPSPKPQPKKPLEKQAKDFGLVNRVVEPEKLSEETEKWARNLSKFSRYTVGFGKKVFYQTEMMSEIEAYDIAKNAIAENCLSLDAQEGLKAFLEKRKPNWKHK